MLGSISIFFNFILCQAFQKHFCLLHFKASPEDFDFSSYNYFYFSKYDSVRHSRQFDYTDVTESKKDFFP